MRNLVIAGLFFSSLVQAQTLEEDNSFKWPNGEKTAISLSYDDALASQLDNAIPSLNKYNIKASFYLHFRPESTVNDRLPEWREVAAEGHELGNHSVYHPCSASLPGRDWVLPEQDLDRYSINQMKDELRLANTILFAIDGRLERTFTSPCIDSLIDGVNYWPLVRELFVAIKGQESGNGFSTLVFPSDVSGQELIDMVKNLEKNHQLINIIFHGIGGDYLTVSKEAHEELLAYLAGNRESYWVDSYITIMKYLKENRNR